MSHFAGPESEGFIIANTLVSVEHSGFKTPSNNVAVEIIVTGVFRHLALSEVPRNKGRDPGRLLSVARSHIVLSLQSWSCSRQALMPAGTREHPPSATFQLM